MEKIPTLFERGPDRRVIDVVAQGCEWVLAGEGVATEKLDGTNIRVTIRSHSVVRVEKRRNPTKEQKARGIIEPWYVDASENAKEDQHIFAAVMFAIQLSFFDDVPDGEHCAEALGPNIQGNPLGLEKGTVCLFNLYPPIVVGCPRSFGAIKQFLEEYTGESIMVGAKEGRFMEGIVFHHPDGRRAKIKRKDFGL